LTNEIPNFISSSINFPCFVLNKSIRFSK